MASTVGKGVVILSALLFCSHAAIADRPKSQVLRQQGQVRQFTNGYSNSIYGIGCTPIINGAKVCGNVQMTDISNIGNPTSIPIDPPFTTLVVSIAEYFFEPGFLGPDYYSSYRYTSCTINRSAIGNFSMTATTVRLAVTVDTSSANCSGFGQLHDPSSDTSSDWSFGGITLNVLANMDTPRFPARSLSAGSISDIKLKAVHRYACDTVSGNQAKGHILFDGYDFEMFNTGAQDNYYNFGQFQHVQCRDSGTTVTN